MLIFDQFKSVRDADAFAVHVRDTFGRGARTCATQAEAEEHEAFPFELRGPVVLVERDKATGPQIEHAIKADVKRFGGKFSGT